MMKSDKFSSKFFSANLDISSSKVTRLTLNTVSINMKNKEIEESLYGVRCRPAYRNGNRLYG